MAGFLVFQKFDKTYYKIINIIYFYQHSFIEKLIIILFD